MGKIIFSQTRTVITSRAIIETMGSLYTSGTVGPANIATAASSHCQARPMHYSSVFNLRTIVPYLYDAETDPPHQIKHNLSRSPLYVFSIIGVDPHPNRRSSIAQNSGQKQSLAGHHWQRLNGD